MEEKPEKKRLRRYSDDEIRQLVRETYIELVYAFDGAFSREEAEKRWELLPERQKTIWQEVMVGVYRQIWFAK